VVQSTTVDQCSVIYLLGEQHCVWHTSASNHPAGCIVSDSSLAIYNPKGKKKGKITSMYYSEIDVVIILSHKRLADIPLSVFPIETNRGQKEFDLHHF
jgi:hypothetical protein